jgi:hypothetical protein
LAKIKQYPGPIEREMKISHWLQIFIFIFVISSFPVPNPFGYHPPLGHVDIPNCGGLEPSISTPLGQKIQSRIEEYESKAIKSSWAVLDKMRELMEMGPTHSYVGHLAFLFEDGGSSDNRFPRTFTNCACRIMREVGIFIVEAFVKKDLGQNSFA